MRDSPRGEESAENWTALAPRCTQCRVQSRPLAQRSRWMKLGLVASSLFMVGATKQPVHIVHSGDTLWEIARRYGCTSDELRHANELQDDVLRVGRKLRIPGCAGEPRRPGTSALVHVVEPGETLSALALAYETSVEELVALNELDGTTIRVGQMLIVRGTYVQVRVVAGQSVGRPHRGRLDEGVQLPHDRGYYRRRPHWAFGAQHVVDFVRRAVHRVRRVHPEVHRLAIGDLSTPQGGLIPGHRSHQSGRDVDLGLYFEHVPSGYPEEFVRADEGKLDVAATWTLVESLWKASKEPGGPEDIFLDYDLQEVLYRYARKQGVSKRALAEIFQYPNGRWAKDRLVSHEPKHDDHLHVRFACPPDDEHCR